jgi:hypothetical protein
MNEHIRMRPAARWRGLAGAVAGLVASALLAACPGDPELNSVVTAHGNTDWHIDTAQEFLYGTQMDGATTAANHVPNSWNRRHAHVGLSNTSHFYNDQLLFGGNDYDATNGIDRPMLFFYAGHGNATLWNTLGDNATQSSLKLGNWVEGTDGGGSLRYYWQCSCDVFAHGPRVGSCPRGAGQDYGCPQEFSGASDSYDMRNVYQRWGPALGSGLRMACGASTLAYCHESQANKIWDNYNNKGYDVTDSFIDGLDQGTVVPLCITRGGASVSSTPLYDQTFTNIANQAGTGQYHIQFLSSFQKPPLIRLAPRFLAVWKLKPDPPPFDRAKLAEIGLKNLRVDEASGAVYGQGERKTTPTAQPLADADYIRRASTVAALMGPGDKLGEAAASRFMLASVDEQSHKPLGTQQKSVLVRFKRSVEGPDGVAVPVLGEGGEIAVQLNNDGSVMNANRVWRALDGVARMTAVKPADVAEAEARRLLGNQESSYRVARMQLGYREESGNVKQAELKASYHFEFEAAVSQALELPPRAIDLPAQD